MDVAMRYLLMGVMVRLLLMGSLSIDLPTNGYQDSMETSIDGCSSLYVGDIEIHIEEIVASTHSFQHRDIVS